MELIFDAFVQPLFINISGEFLRILTQIYKGLKIHHLHSYKLDMEISKRNQIQLQIQRLIVYIRNKSQNDVQFTSLRVTPHQNLMNQNVIVFLVTFVRVIFKIGSFLKNNIQNLYPQFQKCKSYELNILLLKIIGNCPMLTKCLKFLTTTKKYITKFYFSQIKDLEVQYQNLSTKIDQDIITNFNQYYQIQHSFNQITSRAINTPNLPNIYQSEQFVNVLHKLNKYPYLSIPQYQITLLEKQLNKTIHLLPNNSLNICLITFLKSDKNFHQSLIYYQFVKFYVGQWQEWLRVKYTVNLRQENVGSLIKKVFMKLMINSFMSRKPQYERVLNITDIPMLLNEGLRNNSINQSRVYIKTFLRFFHLTKQFYEKQMKQNLYHQKNVILYDNLSLITHTLISNLSINGLQKLYLRELYIHLYLVIKKLHPKNVIYMYHLIKDYLISYNQNKLGKENISKSQILCQFIKKVQDQFQVLVPQCLKNLTIDQLILIYKYFPKTVIWSAILEKLSPLLFHHQCQQILNIANLQNAKKDLYEKISLNQDYFRYLDLKYVIKIIKDQTNTKYSSFIYLYGLRNIQTINKKQTINQNFVSILEIYQKIVEGKDDQFKIQDLQILIKKLRVFLFRYISDNYAEFPLTIYVRIITILYKLNDWQKFNDPDNNYPFTIFKQLNEYNNKKLKEIQNINRASGKQQEQERFQNSFMESQRKVQLSQELQN